MGDVAAGLSLAATGLSAGSKVAAGQTAAANDTAQAQTALIGAQNMYGQAANARAQAYETSEGYKFKSKNLSDSAEYGRLSAAQTDTSLRQSWADKLASMAVVRAASGGEGGPTTFALMNRTQAVGDQDRSQQVQNIRAQSDQDQIASAFYAKSATDALSIGRMTAEQYRRNAKLQEQQAQTFYANAATDSATGWLGGAGGLLTGMAGLPFLKDIKTGF